MIFSLSSEESIYRFIGKKQVRFSYSFKKIYQVKKSPLRLYKVMNGGSQNLSKLSEKS